ncbi:MAG: hypothetical protein FJX76_05350 [Armatimonadetes bacterium]|nr:hypothetical protein [Armatimonadota bacterium]
MIGRFALAVRLWPLLILTVLALPASASKGPSDALGRLLRALPGPGQIVDMKTLGITVGSLEKPPAQIEGGFNFRTPADLDRRSTDSGELKGKFPGLHLNVPLHVVPDDVSFLFLSDQPEEIRDDRLREDQTRGATGVYARSSLPGKAPVRLMLDHTDGADRPLTLWLLWVPRQDGVVMVRKRGLFSHKDSVHAARRAFEQNLETPVEPRVGVRAGAPHPLFQIAMKPHETAVAQMEFVSTVPGELVSVVTEASAPMPAGLAEIDALPVLHSIVWKEEAERLKKFIDPALLPRRYKRIMEAYQHARGHFHYPDRMATVTYNVPRWSAHPVRAYTLYESVPGWDQTIRDPKKRRTDNRGKYGAVVGMRVKIQALPPGCDRMALIVLNPYNTFGGRHLVTNVKDAANEVLFLPGGRHGLLPKEKAAVLWLGNVKKGDVITMTTEPMANISVYLWYLLLPIPKETA